MVTNNASLRRRYGDAAALPEIVENETIDGLLSHRSVRAYLPLPLPSGALPTLIAAAQSAATSSNLQAWSVVAVEDADRKRELAVLAGDQEHIGECPLFLVWLADLSRLGRIAERRALPFEAVAYTEALLLATIDAALAAQNAAVAAESLGLGTVYIGGMRNRPLDVAAALNLPQHVFAVFGMCVGWPDTARPASIKPRLPQTAVLHRESYATAGEEHDVAAYNAAMAVFYDEQQMHVQGDWATHSARRMAGDQSLSGRHTLRAALERLGFPQR